MGKMEDYSLGKAQFNEGVSTGHGRGRRQWKSDKGQREERDTRQR